MSGGAQCFPLFKYYEKISDDDLFSGNENDSIKKSNISPHILNNIRIKYKESIITDEDIFYYVYGLLSSKEYQTKFANNLIKSIARLPLVTSKTLFWILVKFGRELAKIQLEYKKSKLYPVKIKYSSDQSLKLKKSDLYKVEKMRFGGNRENEDKSTVIYNSYITIENIPLEAYEYVINSKPALEWIMWRQGVKVDKDSGIINDANDYANETMNNPAYPLELFQRVITVSLETMKIVKSLPPLDL